MGFGKYLINAYGEWFLFFGWTTTIVIFCVLILFSVPLGIYEHFYILAYGFVITLFVGFIVVGIVIVIDKYKEYKSKTLSLKEES